MNNLKHDDVTGMFTMNCLGVTSIDADNRRVEFGTKAEFITGYYAFRPGSVIKGTSTSMILPMTADAVTMSSTATLATLAVLS